MMVVPSHIISYNQYESPSLIIMLVLNQTEIMYENVCIKTTRPIDASDLRIMQFTQTFRRVYVLTCIDTTVPD